jgi:hypothetical protein
MARSNISKSRRKATPGITKNGKVKLRSVSITKLQEMLEKAQRPRDKDKISRSIKHRQKHG